MKFKNPAHQEIYNAAVNAVETQKWDEASQGLQTLVLFLQESRELSAANQINDMIQSLNHPTKREVMAAKLKAQNEAKLKAIQEKQKAKDTFKSEIDALEEVAHKEFDSLDFFNAAISYGAVAAKTKGLPQYKENHAAAIWSEASAYESLAYEIATTTPLKAQGYIDKAIKRVKESLVVYQELDSTYDIDECIKKINALKQYKDTLQTQIKQNETSQSALFESLDKVKGAYAVPDSIEDCAAAILIALSGTPVYVRGFSLTKSTELDLKKSHSEVFSDLKDKTQLTN